MEKGVNRMESKYFEEVRKELKEVENVTDEEVKKIYNRITTRESRKRLKTNAEFKGLTFYQNMADEINKLNQEEENGKREIL